MQSAFKAAMLKLSTLGQNLNNMVDCSDIIPVPKALPASAAPHFPAGVTQNDVEQAVRLPDFVVRVFLAHVCIQCATAPFPTLTTQPGKHLLLSRPPAQLH